MSDELVKNIQMKVLDSNNNSVLAYPVTTIGNVDGLSDELTKIWQVAYTSSDALAYKTSENVGKYFVYVGPNGNDLVKDSVYRVNAGIDENEDPIYTLEEVFVSKDGIEGIVDSKIQAIDVIEQGEQATGSYIKNVWQTDGVLGASTGSFISDISAAVTTDLSYSAPTGKAVVDYVTYTTGSIVSDIGDLGSDIDSINGRIDDVVEDIGALPASITETVMNSVEDSLDDYVDPGRSVAESDVQMASHLSLVNIGNEVRYIGETDIYKAGSIYKVVEGELNTSANTGYNRSNQSANENATTIPAIEIGKGTIDINQNAGLTAPESFSQGTATDSNPKYGYTDSEGDDALGQDSSTYIKESIGPNETPNLSLTAHSTWGSASAGGTTNQVYTLDQSFNKPGVIYGMALNRKGFAENTNADRTNFDGLSNKIYGSHTLKISADATSATVSLTESIYSYMICNPDTGEQLIRRKKQWTNGTNDNKTYCSLWLKYTNSDNEAIIEKVEDSELGLKLNFEVQSTSLESASSGSSITDKFGSDSKNVEFNIPLDNIKTVEGFKSVEVLEVLEAYKPQYGQFENERTTTLGVEHATVYFHPTNNANLFSYAAFTDLKVVTGPSVDFVKRIEYTEDLPHLYNHILEIECNSWKLNCNVLDTNNAVITKDNFYNRYFSTKPILLVNGALSNNYGQYLREGVKLTANNDSSVKIYFFEFNNSFITDGLYNDTLYFDNMTITDTVTQLF